MTNLSKLKKDSETLSRTRRRCFPLATGMAGQKVSRVYRNVYSREREYKKSRDCNLYSRRISPYKFQHEIKKEEDTRKTYYKEPDSRAENKV